MRDGRPLSHLIACIRLTTKATRKQAFRLEQYRGEPNAGTEQSRSHL